MEVHPTQSTQPSYRDDFGQQRHAHSNRSKRKMLGKYYLCKTIGKGSMGKVKLAIDSLTHEQIAVKIVSRNVQSKQQVQPLTDKEAMIKQEKDRAATISREIRTIREASIMLLLDHPNIAKVHELMLLETDYYLFMEYVDGGQLLDYIISHGKLKEKQARHFSRQIASALDYCHRNSIVHRDLKVENILLSRTGVIKLIDFGLSNVFSPTSYLSTFCGSLYFAAPELLDGRLYTGPEVDVWSFGVVIFVLVCGMVPFDDSNMSGMHAKVKKGHVDYPSHLSSDCKSLLKSMLVVNPKKRATMSEIIVHPWMIKGCDKPIENYLPKRKPLQLPVDMKIVHGMRGFEFGSETEIKEALEYLISTEEYQVGAQNVEALSKHPFFNSSESLYHTKILKRISFTYAMNDPQSIPAAYHPLISIYHLVKERTEREELLARVQFPPSIVHYPPAVDTIFSNQNPQSQNTESSTPLIGYSYTADGKKEVHDPIKYEETTTKSSITDQSTLKNPSEFKKGHARKKSDSSFTSIKENVLRRLSRRISQQLDDFNFNKSHTAAPQDQVADKDTITPQDQVANKDTTPIVTINGSHVPDVSTSSEANTDRDRLGIKFNRFMKRSTSVTAKDFPSVQTTKSNEESTRYRRKSVQNPPQIKTKTDKSGSIDGLLAPPLSPTRSDPEHNNGDTLSINTISNQSKASSGHADESIKSVYLKGLFSVSNTSTKKASAIREEIIRVLDEKSYIQYAERKDKFQCFLKTRNFNQPEAGNDFFELSDDDSDTSKKSTDPNTIRFDIYIVKIPWLLGMRGVQFRRISGDPWQYKNTCRRILDGLRL